MDESTSSKKVTLKKIFKWLAYGIVAFIYLCILMRSLVTCDGKIASEVIYNGKTVEAYEGVKDPYVCKYGMADFWRSINDNQMLMLDNLFYSEPARQLQFSVKYNTSYADAPTDNRIPFVMYLIDEDGTRYDESFFKTDLRNGYGYIRICFENIDLVKSVPTGDERKTYSLYIEQPNPDGELEPLADFPLYDGSELNERVPFKFAK